MDSKILFKSFLIFILVVGLWLGSFFVKFLVSDRQEYRKEAVEEFSQKWAGSQQITGPQFFVNEKEDHNYTKLPDSLLVKADVETNLRHRGIYKIPVYTATIDYSGVLTFSPKDPCYKTAQDTAVFIGFSITDLKGLNSDITLKVNGKKYPVTDLTKFGRGYLGAQVPFEDTMRFELKFKLKGIDQLSIQAVGAYTKIYMSSDWKNPSFDGDFLPDDYKIDQNGFSAQWTIYGFNKRLPHQFDFYGIYNTVFPRTRDLVKVKFVLSNNTYRKTDKALKYAFLVFFLTFLVFFFIEMLNDARVHLVQYFLIGLAMVVFYTLLLALSEKIKFDIAYWIASLMTTSLIAVYFGMILKSKNIGLTVFVGLNMLYGFIFVLLNLQDYALLIGSLGMFLIVALLMYLSLKIKWYKK